MIGRFLGLLVLLQSCGGCGVAQEKKAAETALDALNTSQRRTVFETTASILDEHPEYIDELYAVLRLHTRAMRGFVANVGRDLENQDMARMTSAELVKNPRSLAQTLETATDLVVRDRPARAAMNRALASRAYEAVDVITDDEDTLDRLLKASLRALEKKPAAKKVFVKVVREERARIWTFIKDDQGLMLEVSQEILREAVRGKPVIEKLLRAAKVITDEE